LREVRRRGWHRGIDSRARDRARVASKGCRCARRYRTNRTGDSECAGSGPHGSGQAAAGGGGISDSEKPSIEPMVPELPALRCRGDLRKSAGRSRGDCHGVSTIAVTLGTGPTISTRRQCIDRQICQPDDAPCAWAVAPPPLPPARKVDIPPAPPAEVATGIRPGGSARARDRRGVSGPSRAANSATETAVVIEVAHCAIGTRRSAGAEPVKASTGCGMG